MGPPDVCLAANLVTCAALEVVSTTSAPLPLDLPLLKGFGSYPVSGPPLLPDRTRLIGNFRTGLLPSILKGLRRIIALSSSLLKVGMGVCRNIGIGRDIVVGSGVEASGGVNSSCIRSALPSSGHVCITSIQAGWRGVNDRLGWVLSSSSSSMMCSTASPTGILLLVVISSTTRLRGDLYLAWGGISSISLVGLEGPG